ncbi:MAG TPA: DUF3379 family protein, partial [Gammaproteobacteria bacterium]|nr:DUF3379 family protein [Gammaproteobacteria bacterium]
VLEHIRDEPEALREGRSVLDAAAVQRELAQHGVRLSEQIGAISYVRICPFEGRQVPHLVVQTPTGPVTVMLLLDEHASGSIVIDKGAFSGRIVPAGNGSIAIVGIGHPVDAAEQSRIVAAVAWEA